MSKKKKKPLPLPESLGLPCAGVESHAHLDLEQFSDDLPEVISRAKHAGVRFMGQVFLGPEKYAENKELFAKQDAIFFLLGIHPCHADQCTDEAIAQMEAAFAQDSRLKGVGEIGLDYYWDDHPRDFQQQVFKKQIAMAKRLQQPIIIHSRDANDDAVAILEEEGCKNYPVLWHCFGANAAMAERLVGNGWHISIPGPVTFPSNTALRDALSVIPEDRLMLETDCPYLTPQPYRGKRNEPAYIVFTAAKVAEVLKKDPSELWKTCGENAIRFFRLA